MIREELVSDSQLGSLQGDRCIQGLQGGRSPILSVNHILLPLFKGETEETKNKNINSKYKKINKIITDREEKGQFPPIPSTPNPSRTSQVRCIRRSGGSRCSLLAFVVGLSRTKIV